LKLPIGPYKLCAHSANVISFAKGFDRRSKGTWKKEGIVI
jgi:hypothetical protein